MLSDNNIYVPVYDQNLAPYTGLAGSATWVFFRNVTSGASAAAPAVTEVMDGATPTGTYKIGKKLDVGARYIGKLDFGAAAVPRFFDYDVRYEEGVSADNILIMAGLVHQNTVIDQTVFNSKGLQTSARVRVFPTALDATNGTNVIATFLATMTPKASPHDDQMDSFLMVLQ